MLDILGRSYRCCDGISRRSFLRAGFLGLAGLSLPDILRIRAHAAQAGRPVKDTAMILVWMGGGPSHLDTYDLKPEAPVEFRGEFRPIKTKVPGIAISEHLPHSAAVMDQFSIVRSLTHPDAGHESATHMLLTGYRPTNDIPDNEMPSCGSVVAKLRGPNAPGLPAYAAVPRAPRSSNAAYLGVAYNPFSVDNDPNNPGFQVRNLQLAGGVDMGRLEHRRALLRQVDDLKRDVDGSGLMHGMDSFYTKAFEMVTGKAARQAFAIDQEDPRLRDKYGRHTWGQSCLLARRLVEAGITFVTVEMGGWDTHGNNFRSLKDNLLPRYDQAFSALLGDLRDRGLDRKVMVIAWGEFGRTPRINPGAGRDHWPGAMSVAIAGGGLKMGQAIGVTDGRAEYPKERPLNPQDVIATMYHVLGIDTNQEFLNEANRPIKVLNIGQPIAELV